MADKAERKAHRFRLWLSTEDKAFLDAIGKVQAITTGALISDFIAISLRAIRTGRDPYTGEPILWRVPDRLLPPSIKSVLEQMEAGEGLQLKRKRVLPPKAYQARARAILDSLQSPE
tara:strand:+ start:20386 stop:20736 length:351 start_codon:yes stop_codon:yes gene_type:complete